VHKLIIRHAAVRSSYAGMHPRGTRELGTMTSQIWGSTSATALQGSKQKWIQPKSNWYRFTFGVL